MSTIEEIKEEPVVLTVDESSVPIKEETQVEEPQAPTEEEPSVPVKEDESPVTVTDDVLPTITVTEDALPELPKVKILDEVQIHPTEQDVSNVPMAYQLLLKIVRSRLPSKINAVSVTGKLVQIISECIKFLSTVKTMSGSEKKQLVILAVKTVIEEKVPEEDRQRVLDIVDTVADPIVDELVSFGYNTYLFIKSKLSALLSKLSCCSNKNKFKTLRVEVPKELIIELSKFVDTHLQRPYSGDKVIKLISAAVKYMQAPANKSYYGATKKDTVLHVVRVVIEQSDKLKNTDRAELISVLDQLGSDFVDAAVDFGKLTF
jgi:hypothetical protein